MHLILVVTFFWHAAIPQFTEPRSGGGGGEEEEKISLHSAIGADVREVAMFVFYESSCPQFRDPINFQCEIFLNK